MIGWFVESSIVPVNNELAFRKSPTSNSVSRSASDMISSRDFSDMHKAAIKASNPNFKAKFIAVMKVVSTMIV